MKGAGIIVVVSMKHGQKECSQILAVCLSSAGLGSWPVVVGEKSFSKHWCG